MPNVTIGPGQELEVPLLNAAPGKCVAAPSDDEDDDGLLYPDADEVSFVSSFSGSEASDPAAERLRREPKEDGRYYDDPLWFGKTLVEIRRASEIEKSGGNQASSRGEWKEANRRWKNALRGAEKLGDAEMELRLRLNLALGYIKRSKPAKALEQCDEIFKERLLTAASPALRAKAHFRRATAHEVVGDTSKAVSSLLAALEIDPECAEAKQRLAHLRKEEAEQRARERALYEGKLQAAAAPPAPPDGPSEEPPKEEQQQACGEIDSSGVPRSLTDRSRSARLFQGLGQAGPKSFEEDDGEAPGPALNVEWGAPVQILGPIRPSAPPAG